MPSTTNIPFWTKYFTVELVVFFYFYGFLTFLPIGRIYIYQSVSDMKGFPFENVSQETEGCGEKHLQENSTLRELEQEVCRNWK